MGALIYHEASYPTEFPRDGKRTLEIVTFDNAVYVRISATGDERMNNQRVAVSLTKAQAAALIIDLQSATDYVFGGDYPTPLFSRLRRTASLKPTSSSCSGLSCNPSTLTP